MTAIKEWEKRHKKVRRENVKYVKSLAKKNKRKGLDEIANKMHKEVFKKVSCLDCANCCSTIPPIVTATDSKRIAKHLGMKLVTFKEEYIVEDEDGDMVINQTPCPFLESDKTCYIYDVRPKACQQYPHTDNSDFVQNLHLHAQNAQYCPAVFHILEKMKANFV
ncbi:MAG: YkgJ family cysteine cluster protein [Chitinophagales bacterium]